MNFCSKATLFGIFGLVALVAVLAPSAAYAIDATERTALEDKISEYICSDGGKMLKCYGIKSTDCSSVAHSFVKPCVDTVFLGVTQMLTYEQGVNSAHRLMACFDERFMQSHSKDKLKTSECL